MVLKGQQEATNALIKLKGQASAFEGMVDKNINLMLNISNELPRTGIPVLNRAIQRGQRELLSDDRAIRLYDAVQTVVTEYARMMGSMGMSGAVITNEQRDIANKFIDAGFSHDALVNVSKFLKQEMNNKIQSLNETISGTIGGIPTLPGEQTPSPKPSGNLPAGVKNIRILP
jgi:hypothetical protein